MEKKEPSLTELADTQIQLVKKLKQHTDARNFLWSVIQGDVPPPIMFLKQSFATTTDNKGDVLIDTGKLSSEAMESIILTALQHEELSAFEAWSVLEKNANKACSIIDNLKRQREAESRPVDGGADPAGEDSEVNVIRFPIPPTGTPCTPPGVSND